MSTDDKTIPGLDLLPENIPILGNELFYITKDGVDYALNLARIFSNFPSSISDWFTLEGDSPNQYMLCKFPFASPYEIQAFTNSGWLPGSIWESLPIASANTLGAIIIGNGLAVVNGVVSVSGSFNSSFAALSGSPYDNTNLHTALDGKADLVEGKIPSAQLPSYVDDVVEATTYLSLPAIGEIGKIYITLDTNLAYRWSGSVWAEISPSLALGETSATAYRGDYGKIAYDHSQITHNASLVGLGNVTNESKATMFTSPTFTGTVTMPTALVIPDAGYIGLGAAKGRIQFDDEATDTISFLGCNVGINTTTPSNLLEVISDSGIRVRESSDTNRANSIYVGADSTGPYIKSTYGTGGNMNLRIMRNTAELVRFTDVGIGLGLTSPTHKLHQDSGTGTATYHQFTAGTTTGQTASDGLIIGIDASGNAIINQRENLGVYIYSNNTLRLKILGSGLMEFYNGATKIGELSTAGALKVISEITAYATL